MIDLTFDGGVTNINLYVAGFLPIVVTGPMCGLAPMN